jgi:hypothetical protein
MSVILTTEDTEIRSIVVRSQPGKIVHDTLLKKKEKPFPKKGWWNGSRRRP